MTRTASHSSLLSLGSWIGAAVTVPSNHTTLPSSSLSCRALRSSARLISSQVSGRIALIVFCSTDFRGHHDHGSRAKAQNEAGSSMEGQFLIAQLPVLLQQRAAQDRLSRQALASSCLERRADTGLAPPAQPDRDARPASPTSPSIRSRSRARRKDRICWLGRCVLGALSAPAVAGTWNQWHDPGYQKPPGLARAKLRFVEQNQSVLFMDGN